MDIVAAILVVVVATLHAFFLVLEMFLWTTAYGRKVFGTTPEVARSSATLAANQAWIEGTRQGQARRIEFPYRRAACPR